MSMKTQLRSLITLLLFATLSVAATAQSPDIAPPQIPPETEPEQVDVDTLPDPLDDAVEERLNRDDLAGWLDGFMPYALADGDIAGAVVTVVKDGEILLNRGYGYADLASRTPVDPDRTLFRPGSVSKLFTWTAVMQLVDEGRLDLDADISAYLDFEVPVSDGPLTLRHLMTHTPGYGEVVKDLIIEDPANLMSLEEYLRDHKPAAIFPAGEVPAYSNYATALAGHVVAEVSGMSFEDYVQSRIFEPLDMTRSTFRQPLPEALQPLMSSGYISASSGEAQPFELVPPGPAGSMSATGADMGRFMVAHLAQGGPLMSEEAARRMHTEANRTIPPLNAMLLGFYEQDRAGRSIIGHGGDTQYFHSNLHLYLDEGVGLFVSMNSTGNGNASGQIRDALFAGFTDRYFPVETEDRPTLDTAAEHGAQVAGVYENSRGSRTNFIAALSLVGQAKLAMNEDHELVTDFLTDAAGQPKRWREVEPYVWQEVNGPDRLAVRFEDGKVHSWSVDPYAPFMTFLPPPTWRSSALLIPLISIALGVLTLTALLWPVRAVVRWRYAKPFPLSGRRALGYRAVRTAAFAGVAYIAAWAWLIIFLMSDLANLNGSGDPFVLIMQVAMIIPLTALVIGIWNAALVWKGPSSWFGKAWSIPVALSFVILAWFSIAAGFFNLGLNY